MQMTTDTTERNTAGNRRLAQGRVMWLSQVHSNRLRFPAEHSMNTGTAASRSRWQQAVRRSLSIESIVTRLLKQTFIADAICLQFVVTPPVKF
jgi:hypothetical protein